MELIMRKHYERILRDSDKRVKRSLAIQVLDDPQSEFYGGFRDLEGLIEPKYAIYRVTTMISCYYNKDSRWFGNEEVYHRLLLGLEYIRRNQRENGFFDLINCNFYSAPDTAFCIKRLLPTYEYLDKFCSSTDEKTKVLIQLLREIIINGANAMVNGGFHTPNHRWAIASVLMVCNKLFGNQTYVEAANKYLIEGIDCNKDGEYAERSAGNYNRINNDAMILIAEATGDDSYLEYPIRNLQMMLTYFEPDGSIFTNNSTRQDRGKKVYPKDYYFEYLYLGKKLNNTTFLNTANYIMELVEEKNLTAMDCLMQFMLHPDFIDFEHEGSSIPVSYKKFYQESNIVRCRNKDYSYSIINQSPTFLYFQHGDLTVSLKIGASFCEHRYFISQALKQEDERFLLKDEKLGWYYLPFKTPQNTTDWWKMDNASRDKLYGPNMNFDVIVSEEEDGLNIRLKTTGIDRAPVRLELAFDKDVRIETKHFVTEGTSLGGIIAKDGYVTASKGEYAIEVGPAFGTHDFITGKFGSDGRNPHCYTVYFTDYTCFDHTITIRAKDSKY